MKNYKKAFTLVEVIIVVSVFSVLMITIINIYKGMVSLKYNIQAKQNLLENSYFVMERLNVLLKDYTVDYEEYFNRSAIWCSSTDTFQNFERDITDTVPHCTYETAYWNNNSFLGTDAIFSNYYCSSFTWENTPFKVYKNLYLDQWSGCAKDWFQSYWQYKYQFIDMKSDVDSRNSIVADDDDEDLWIWPVAIYDQENVKELYLISQDRTQRLLLRRALIASGDFNGTWWVWDIPNEKLYTIQILKLRWFDAWNNHDFDIANSSGVYDGNIDTWACDYSQWFICKGDQISNNIYSGYQLPADIDDGWTNLFDGNLTITNRNISVYPTKDPDYSFSDNFAQMNPYFTISFSSKLYGGIWWNRLKKVIEEFHLDLKTTFNTRNNYTK